jgi:hypothetical protein
VPPHGTLALVRQQIADGRAAGNSAPDDGAQPVWIGTGAPALAGATTDTQGSGQ